MELDLHTKIKISVFETRLAHKSENIDFEIRPTHKNEFCDFGTRLTHKNRNVTNTPEFPNESQSARTALLNYKPTTKRPTTNEETTAIKQLLSIKCINRNTIKQFEMSRKHYYSIVQRTNQNAKQFVNTIKNTHTNI